MNDTLRNQYVSKYDVINALCLDCLNGDLDENRCYNFPCAEIEAVMRMPVTQPELDEWCDDCKEYDHETHSCPRFNRVIRETLDDVRKDAYKHGKSKGIKRGMAMARRKEAGND